MNIVGSAARLSRPRRGTQIVVSLLSLILLLASSSQNMLGSQDAQTPAQAPTRPEQDPPYAQQTPEQLQRLVAPIALYPDSLVAQILAAATFPEQVVEADRWIQAHPGLKDEALAQAVDQQPWDPSVKALAAFPSVLGNMDKNLSWTSSLGDAYYNHQQEVMDAVQVMRQKAERAGNLKSSPQQTVTTEDSTIVIEPASPEIVYVPAYDPWVIYGDPIVAWPGWYGYPGIWFDGPDLWFGVGFGIGFFGGFGWGWGHWGFDWHNHYAVYNRGRYYSESRVFYNRNSYYRGGDARGPGGRGGFNGDRGGDRGRSNAGNRPPDAGRGDVFNRPGGTSKPFEGDNRAARGYAEPHGESGTRSGAFSGYDHGGETRSYSSRGSASMGGGGMRGGGGGSHGGHR